LEKKLICLTLDIKLNQIVMKNIEEPIEKIDSSLLKELLEELNITPTKEILNRIVSGKETPLIERLYINGEYKSGKIEVFKDNKGASKFKFNKKEEKLIIPDKILDHRLTEDEKKNLKSGETIIIKKEGRGIAVGVDQDLNKVAIKGVTTLSEIGGYKLTENEKKDIAAGKRVGPKVLYNNKTDQYIRANISLTENGKSVKLSSLEVVSQELIEKYNSHENQVTSAPNISSEVKSQIQELKNENEILKMVAAFDIQKLSNSSPSSVQVLNKVLESNEYNSLDENSKLAVEVALNQANQGNIKEIVLKEKINEAMQLNSPEKLAEAIKDEKVTKELLQTISTTAKENGKEDTFKEVVEKIEKDLSPQTKTVAISKTKNITK
jgi:hypothetical protein